MEAPHRVNQVIQTAHGSAQNAITAQHKAHSSVLARRLPVTIRARPLVGKLRLVYRYTKGTVEAARTFT